MNVSMSLYLPADFQRQLFLLVHIYQASYPGMLSVLCWDLCLVLFSAKHIKISEILTAVCCLSSVFNFSEGCNCESIIFVFLIISQLVFVCRVVTLWRESLAKKNQKAAQSLANPSEYENLFPGLQDSLKTEQFLKEQYRQRISAVNYPSVTVNYF